MKSIQFLFKMIPQIILILFLMVVFPIRSFALEPDQYKFNEAINIRDSADTINSFLNENLPVFLEKKINWRKKQPFTCQKVAVKYFFYIRPNILKNRLKTYLFKVDKVDLYPAKKRLFYDYGHSIYRGFVWPFIMPVAQIMKINNVYLGTDKIDHFFSSGRRYLNTYLRARKKGFSRSVALMKAIDFGISLPEEKGILGLLSSAAFSYADLESNYQGMMLGIDMCEGDHPYLQWKDGTGWVQARPIDIRKYVTPLWDESFNNSYFAKFRWKRIEKILQEEHCTQEADVNMQKLWKSYLKRISPSLRTNYLRGLIYAENIPNPQNQNLSVVCNYPKNVMKGMPFWDMPYNENTK